MCVKHISADYPDVKGDRMFVGPQTDLVFAPHAHGLSDDKPTVN